MAKQPRSYANDDNSEQPVQPKSNTLRIKLGDLKSFDPLNSLMCINVVIILLDYLVVQV